MPYNANIPQPNDELSQSQDEMLNNFQSISALINVNHIDFNGATQGKHKWVSLPNQVLAPQALANELVLYTKEVNGNPQLFLRRQNDGAEIDFTSAGFGNPGWCRLPSGILLKWGVFNGVGNTNITIPFAVGATIPVFNACYIVQVQSLIGNGGASAPQVSNITNVQFDMFSRRIGLDNATGQFNYLAIGI
jgi:hypothetical protein